MSSHTKVGMACHKVISECIVAKLCIFIETSSKLSMHMGKKLYTFGMICGAVHNMQELLAVSVCTFFNLYQPILQFCLFGQRYIKV